MTQLRVAVDATSMYGARTGVGRFTTSLLDELANHRTVEVVAYAVTWRRRSALAALLPRGVSAVEGRLAARPLRSLWQHVDHPRIEHWTGPIDVVHGPNYVVPPARAARVATVHDLTFVHYPEFCTKDVLQYNKLLRRAIDQGTWIHTVSEFVREEVIDHLAAAPERVVAVPLGVAPPPSLDASRGRSLAGGGRYLLALGTIEPRKNLPLLVEAFDELAAGDNELRLVVAGPDGWGLDQYEHAVQRAHHRDRIIRVGYVSEIDRGDLIAGASVVAVPSHYEGFGLTAAEAMLAGTPVVASSAGSHNEVIGDGGLLVTPNDGDALAAALDQVLSDTNVAEDLRVRGTAQARRYTWPATASGIVELWRRAVAG